MKIPITIEIDCRPCICASKQLNAKKTRKGWIIYCDFCRRAGLPANNVNEAAEKWNNSQNRMFG
jgi:hypothetical protein